MTRRLWLAAAALLASCGKSAAPRELPATLGEGWRQTRLHEGSADGGGVIPTGSIKRMQKAVYESAAGKLDVTFYELASSATALDAVQRWRPAADTVFFYRDEYFVVVRYQATDRKAVNTFVRELDKILTPPR